VLLTKFDYFLISFNIFIPSMAKQASKKATPGRVAPKSKPISKAKASKPKSHFTKTVNLYKDQKDWFHADDYYKNK